ncbi:MAG: class I SAM-dependent methyltransferase [Verrucomicrobia bacterium]|nr:class I SAM-dependent methyltransferase [Verrucomicrobiota bacterium]
MGKPPTRAEAKAAPAARLRLRVSTAAEAAIRSGHPWVFAESIREQNREGQLGELAVIYDRRDRFLALGLFDPESPLRVRVLHAGQPQVIDEAWWRARLQRALARRAGLFDEQTTGYRLIHGESDGWPGLVLDRYDTTLVLKLYTAAWLPRLDEVMRLISEAVPHERLVLRLSRNIQRTAQEAAGFAEGFLVSQKASEPVSEKVLPTHRLTRSPAHKAESQPTTAIFLETGMHFEADVVRGQKTGFFLDQRENRRLVETLARGRDVLNAFSFTGGFSVYAARGGAKSVTDLDISAHALAGARRNLALNKSHRAVAACRHVEVQADAFDWLSGAPSQNFDLIILDPPSLAKREAERAGALQAYRRLARSGLARLRDGGILVAASCSAHVSAPEFFTAIRHAARETRQRFTELRTTGHPPDHPAGFKEADYLKCIYLQF